MPPGRRYDGSVGPAGRRPRPSAPPKGVGPTTAGGGGGGKSGCPLLILSVLLLGPAVVAAVLGHTPLMLGWIALAAAVHTAGELLARAR